MSEDIQDVAEKLMKKFPGVGEFVFEGHCAQCQNSTAVSLQFSNREKGVYAEISGGALFGFDLSNKGLFKSMKCQDCWEKHGETEVYSRIVGYMRPVSQWNTGKRKEFEKRKMIDLQKK